MQPRTTQIILAVLLVSGCQRTAESETDHFTFRTGEDSLKYTIAISDDERRGESPLQDPQNIKKELAQLLATLRADGKGLKQQTEFNIESYFTVADAFEADGLLVQAVDYLSDLKHKLKLLVDARAGQKQPNSLIETEDDILNFRDSHNIHVLDDKYMAGAQPTEKGYRWLKSKGVSTIINLRQPSKHEQDLIEGLGMTYVHIPWADKHPPSMAQIREMLAAVKNSEGRVFQHCLRGIGRDMTMAGCYMIAQHGEQAADFIEQGRKDAPRWESDQKRDKETNEPVQFQQLREFEAQWKRDNPRQ